MRITYVASTVAAYTVGSAGAAGGAGLQLLVLLSSTRYPHEAKQRRPDVGQEKEDHDGRQCRDRADQRKTSASQGSAGRSIGR